VNLLPYLNGENSADPHDMLFWRFGPQKAVRKSQWKLVDWRDLAEKTQSGWQLYDLDHDIGETTNLAAQHPEIVADLSVAWDNWNRKNIAPIWHGTPNEDPSAPQPARAKGTQKTGASHLDR